jgi:hypothetical protein
MKAFMLLLLVMTTSVCRGQIFPHVVAGGGWATKFTVHNNSFTATQTVTIELYTEAGLQWARPTTFRVGPKETLIAETATDGPLQQGWAKSTGGTAIVMFRQSVPGRADFEAAELVKCTTTTGSTSPIPPLTNIFDNRHGASTGMALLNTSSLELTVLVTFYDGLGKTVSESLISLAAKEKAVLSLPEHFPASRENRGAVTLEIIRKSGQSVPTNALCATALQFNSTGSFTTLPW